MKEPRPCVSCGKPTKYICTDCLLEGKGFIPLCGNSTCKIKHESEAISNAS